MGLRYLIVVSMLLTVLGCSRGEPTVTASATDAAPLGDSDPSVYESAYSFDTPVRLKAEGQFISVESPGYACPTVADIDQDGKLDLIVGQFSDGSMQLFKNEGETTEEPRLLATGWIQSNGQRAVVPGVW